MSSLQPGIQERPLEEGATESSRATYPYGHLAEVKTPVAVTELDLGVEIVAGFLEDILRAQTTEELDQIELRFKSAGTDAHTTVEQEIQVLHALVVERIKLYNREYQGIKTFKEYEELEARFRRDPYNSELYEPTAAACNRAFSRVHPE